MDTLKKEIFWETLGPHYVYGYKNAQGEWVYIGEGKLKRGADHVEEKDLNIYDLEIIAQNIGTKAEALTLESYLLKKHKPILNTQPGHHEERFIETKVVTLAEAWEAAQVTSHDIYDKIRDEFSEVFKWATDFYSDSNKVVFHTGAIQKVVFRLLVDKSFKTTVRFDCQGGSDEVVKENARLLGEHLKKEYSDFEVSMGDTEKYVLLYTNTLEDGTSIFVKHVKEIRGIK
tara:strand:- start:7148 stop:7837 length:690 start_codon:yes stop_codon:yes gene_type:complete